MSEVLARIRVKEEHGIRRFLYPLWVQLPLAEGTDPDLLSLTTPDGQLIPTQGTQRGKGRYRLDFAVSLSPNQEHYLLLTHGQQPATFDDSMTFDSEIDVEQADYAFGSRQKRFSVMLDMQCNIRAVLYDGKHHLRDATSIRRNSQVMKAGVAVSRTGDNLLTAWLKTRGQYEKEAFLRDARTRTELTACKSWATVTHKLHTPKANDEVAFTLPLAVTSPVLTCDFGVGGGTYGKLQHGAAEEVTWHTKFEGDNARWSIATSGRTDYEGKTTRDAFRSQQWFHLIDSDKSLAVAMTDVPSSCQEMRVLLNVTGDVTVTFRLDDVLDNKNGVEFGVCYHFLNDVPAVAAATNPQSILLPPTVEMLPA